MMTSSTLLFDTGEILFSSLTRSLREPGGPCTKSMEVSESRMERVNIKIFFLFNPIIFKCIGSVDSIANEKNAKNQITNLH